MGHARVGSGEHSIKALKTKATQLARVKMMLEESPQGEFKNNGDIESAMMEVRGLMRSIQSD